MSTVTIVIVVIVVWCAVAVVLALALGGVLRSVSRDDTPADQIPDDRRDEPRKTA
jgi:hypothetical protein